LVEAYPLSFLQERAQGDSYFESVKAIIDKEGEGCVIHIGLNMGVLKAADIPGSPNAPLQGLSAKKLLKTFNLLHKHYKNIKSCAITEFNPSIEDFKSS